MNGPHKIDSTWPKPLVTIGVLADTHIPDRIRKLPIQILEIFQNAGVVGILHAGDISIPSVLEELSQIAPVTAVRGNRDLIFRKTLPLKTSLVLAGVTLGLTHGHGGWGPYLWDKAQFLTVGYRFERYHRRLRLDFPEASVIVFGHTHRCVNQWESGRLIFNPGSACCPMLKGGSPTIGLLRFYPEQKVVGEIVGIDQ